MLPAVVPKTRIMAYSYDSNWQMYAPRTRLELCGEDLVHNIHAFRKNERNRPIIFIGHSLGGLVIQHVSRVCALRLSFIYSLSFGQALLYANGREDLRYLPEHTVGLLTLGTPFRGASAISKANVAAKLLSVFGSHRGILQDLEYDNQHMKDKLHKLCELQQSLRIPACFCFELYQTNYKRQLWVLGMVREMVCS